MSVCRRLNVGWRSGDTHFFKHAQAERAVFLHANVDLSERFRASVLLCMNWQLGTATKEGKKQQLTFPVQDGLIGKDREKYPTDKDCYFILFQTNCLVVNL